MGFTLGLDLDGVCGDYISEFRHHVSRATGTHPDLLPDPEHWEFTKAGWGIDDLDQYLALHGNAVMDGMFRSMPAFAGVSESLWRLSDAGVDIRIITHRLIGKNQHATAAADTVAWLDRHNIPYRDICFVARKAHVDADVYIDDAPHNVEALRAAGGDVIVFDASYNRDVTGPRARDWAQAEALVLQRLHAWQDNLDKPSA